MYGLARNVDATCSLVVKATVALIVMSVLHGCAYTIPIKDNEPTATIRFVDPRNAADGSFLHQVPTTIAFLDEQGCAELGGVAALVFLNNYKMELTVPVSRTLFFQWSSAAPVFGASWHCKLVTGFSPEANHLYEARFDMNIQKQLCSVEFVKILQRADGTTNAVRFPMLSKPLKACKANALQ